MTSTQINEVKPNAKKTVLESITPVSLTNLNLHLPQCIPDPT